MKTIVAYLFGVITGFVLAASIGQAITSIVDEDRRREMRERHDVRSRR